MRTLNSIGIFSVILLLISFIWSCNDEGVEPKLKENDQLKQDLQGSWFYSRSYGGVANAPYIDSSYSESNTSFRGDSLIWYDSTYYFDSGDGQNAQVTSGSYYVYYTYSGGIPNFDLSRYNRSNEADVLLLKDNGAGVETIKNYKEVDGKLVLDEVWAFDYGLPRIINCFVTFNSCKDTVLFEAFGTGSDLYESRFARK